MTLTFNTVDIQKKIPHRYENLLIDECKITEDHTSTFQLKLNQKDVLGRHIFLQHYLDNSIVATPVLTEITALASIISSGEIEPGHFAYFAGITKFNVSKPFKTDLIIHGTTKKISQKQDFFKYEVSLSNGDSNASAQLLAFYSSNDASNDTIDPISLPDNILKALKHKEKTPSLKTKDPSMTFIHFLHPLLSPSEALYGYQYPLTHPFIKGHFPGNPVMMGVCQWMMLEDALTYYLSDSIHKDSVQISCSATIFKKDLTPVCELKSAVLNGVQFQNQWHVTTESVKKILFKQRVIPGDSISIHISNLQVEKK